MSESTSSTSPTLVSPWRRLRYLLTPKRLYAHYRARRDLRRYETELHLLPFLVNRGRNAIDAGANRGSYCYFLARLCPKVYAFEPNPVMRDYLKGVTRKNVQIFDCALSDERGEATFAVPNSPKGYRNTSGTLETNLYEGDSLKFTVPISRLDDEPLENVGFLKMDIEGHELKALEGGRKLIARDRPVMMIEVREELNGKPIFEVLGFIESLGYTTVVMHQDQLLHRDAVDPALFTEMPAGPRADGRIMNFIFLPNRPSGG